MDIGIIGLGRMGANIARRWLRAGHRVVVYDRAPEALAGLAKDGAVGAASLDDLAAQLTAPRAIWLMVPAGIVGAVLDDLAPRLSPEDIIVDGGNSSFQDDLARAASLRTRGVHLVDCGTSGGVWGLERGYCLMIGGDTEAVERLDPVFAALAPGGAATDSSTAARGYLHCGGVGAGHFVKMVHNAIEYGLMAAYAEGFNLLRHAQAGVHEQQHDAETTPLRHPEYYQYDFDLGAIAEVWRHGSVISSWLLDLTARALHDDASLNTFAGRVSDSGEGRWTLEAATDLAVPMPVLSSALFSRFASRGEDDYQNRLLSALRQQFGGHAERSAP